MINSLGQCCGRKPLTYKLDGHRYCPRCDRAYQIGSDEQVRNWAWKENEHGEFVRTDLGSSSR